MNRIVLHGRWWAREAAIWLKPDTAAFVLLAVAAPCLLFPGGWRTLALFILPLIWMGQLAGDWPFFCRYQYNLAIEPTADILPFVGGRPADGRPHARRSARAFDR
jgi:hypothetical protein